jgi:predicted metal-dependent hydrolase
VAGVYPEAYVEYLIHFHADRDLFECHEILEEYWKEHPHDPRSKTWVGLIQVAVALYHHRRGNRRGAVKMLAASLLNTDDRHLQSLGIDAPAFREQVGRKLEGLSSDDPIPFTDMDLPLTDDALLALCENACRERGLVWRQPSDSANRYLIHKHTLRDRSDVIEARQREAERRRNAAIQAEG